MRFRNNKAGPGGFLGVEIYRQGAQWSDVTSDGDTPQGQVCVNYDSPPQCSGLPSSADLGLNAATVVQ